jgi:hypothetical protein
MSMGGPKDSFRDRSRCHQAWHERLALCMGAKYTKCPINDIIKYLIYSGLHDASAPDEEAEHLALGSSKLTGCFSV